MINSSGARQNFHVIEPINQNRWQISYIKPDGGLVPGGHVEIQVKFITPTKAERSGEKGTIYQVIRFIRDSDSDSEFPSIIYISIFPNLGFHKVTLYRWQPCYSIVCISDNRFQGFSIKTKFWIRPTRTRKSSVCMYVCLLSHH